jgi:hypothetical protein
MAKRKLTDLAEEYGISFEEAKDLAFEKFDEDMITGKGKNTWIDERGQAMLDDLVPIDIIYRGRVVSEAPNPAYVIAYVKELTAKVPVRIPMRYKGMLNNKIIHIQADNTGHAPKYNWIPTKVRT